MFDNFFYIHIFFSLQLIYHYKHNVASVNIGISIVSHNFSPYLNEFLITLHSVLLHRINKVFFLSAQHLTHPYLQLLELLSIATRAKSCSNLFFSLGLHFRLYGPTCLDVRALCRHPPPRTVAADCN